MVLGLHSRPVPAPTWLSTTQLGSICVVALRVQHDRLKASEVGEGDLSVLRDTHQIPPPLMSALKLPAHAAASTPPSF